MNPGKHFECNAPDVIFQNFEDETILINLTTGCYYSLDENAMAIWNLVSTCVPVEDILEYCQRAWTGDAKTIETTIRDFIKILLEESLIRPAEDRRSLPVELQQQSTTTTAAKPPDFAIPQLKKYDDMAEMLLLDPVHEVTEAGWPAAKSNTDESAALIDDHDASQWPDMNIRP